MSPKCTRVSIVSQIKNAHQIKQILDKFIIRRYKKYILKRKNKKVQKKH